MTLAGHLRRPSHRQILLAILLLGAAVRIAAAIMLPDQHFPDAIGYRAAGLRLWSEGRLGLPHMMPLYPALVGLVGPGWPQLAADIALSVTAVWLVYRLAVEVFSDRAAALLAAFAAAIYPHFIFFSLTGTTESLFITLLLAAFVFWYRGAFSAAAVVAVLSILTRASLDLLAPILVFYFALIIHRLGWRGSLLKLAAYATVYCVLMAGWWLHNYREYGAFVRLNFGGSEVFFLGNNPQNRSGGGIYGVDGDLTPFNKLPTVERDKALWQAGRDYVRSHPLHFVEMAGVKFLRFWRPWPYAPSYDDWRYIIPSLISVVPMLVLALIYLARWGPFELPRIAPMLLFVGYLTAVHMVTIASIRYRLPAEPFMIVFAAVAATRFARHFTTRRSIETAPAPTAA